MIIGKFIKKIRWITQTRKILFWKEILLDIINELEHRHININIVQNTDGNNSQSIEIWAESSKVNKERKNNRDSEENNQNSVDQEEIRIVCTGEKK